jgi:hypothetical protein
MKAAINSPLPSEERNTVSTLRETEISECSSRPVITTVYAWKGYLWTPNYIWKL